MLRELAELMSAKGAPSAGGWEAEARPRILRVVSSPYAGT
jgi:hypothetical protein